MRANISAERHCYLRMAADVSLIQCHKNITNVDIDEEDNGNTISLNGQHSLIDDDAMSTVKATSQWRNGVEQLEKGGASSKSIECRILQNYLDCFSKLDYDKDCSGMMRVEVEILSRIGPLCDLSISQQRLGSSSTIILPFRCFIVPYFTRRWCKNRYFCRVCEADLRQ